MYNKKTLLITGAAKGIGKAIAMRFAVEGYALALVDIDEAGLNDLGEKLEAAGSDILCLPGDIGDWAFMKIIVSKTAEKWNRIDTLINNAAWRTVETMRTMSISNWDTTIRICLTAPAFLSKYAAAVMEEKKTSGVIINISSIMAQRAGGNSPAYIACKGAIDSLTHELAVLYGPKGIRVITVKPGNIQTDLSDDYVNEEGGNISNQLVEHIIDSTPLQRAGTAKEVADLCYWLSTEESSYITGTSIEVDGGFTHNFNTYSVKKIQFPNQF